MVFRFLDIVKNILRNSYAAQSGQCRWMRIIPLACKHLNSGSLHGGTLRRNISTNIMPSFVIVSLFWDQHDFAASNSTPLEEAQDLFPPRDAPVATIGETEGWLIC